MWLGTAESNESFEQFLAEDMTTDGPVSAFAASQGETFIDSDFLEFFHAEGQPSLSDLLAGASYGESFIPEVIAAAPAIAINCAILGFEEEFSSPRSCKGEGITLTYIGEFDYDPSSRPFHIAGRYGYALLEVLSGGPVHFQGTPVTSVKVDAFGLMIGKGVNPYTPLLDISSSVPETADAQVRISVGQDKSWEIRDFGENGLTRVDGRDFGGQSLRTLLPLRFSIGSVELQLTPQPEG